MSAGNTLFITLIVWFMGLRMVVGHPVSVAGLSRGRSREVPNMVLVPNLARNSAVNLRQG